MEAELNALSDTGRQALYVCKHFIHLGVDKNVPIQIYCDNQSALTIVKSPNGMHHGWLKHHDIKIKHLHDENEKKKKKITIDYCPTNEMPHEGTAARQPTMPL